MGGITLEITVQLAAGLCPRQFIVRLGEVIHTHIVVVGCRQLVNAVSQNRQFFPGIGQIFGVDAALRFKAFRQVGIVKHRQPVRAHLDNGVQGAVEGFQALERQAVDQIHIDGAEAQFPRFLHDRTDHAFRLNTVNGFLYFVFEVLHAKADAVKAQLAQQFQGVGAQFARVDFNREIGISGGAETELRAQKLHQLGQLLVGQKGGGAAAQVQLFDRRIALQQRAFHTDFLLQNLQVRC